MRLKLFVASLFLSSTLLFAQSAFDGTWHFNMDSAQLTDANDKFSMENGTYRCDSCNPKVEVKADGRDHPRSGSPYSDTINVRQISDREIEVINKKKGKVVGTNKMTVSADGKTLTSEWESIFDNGQKGNGKVTEARVGNLPGNSMMASSNSKSSSKITGEWKPEKVNSASENVMTYTYKMTNDTFSMSSPQGTFYEAKLDGSDAPYKGDPGTTTVSVKKIDATHVDEFDKRDGKVIGIAHLSVDPDGKQLKLSYEDKLQGGTFNVTAEKQ
jgi:hypothetical protein